MSGYLSSLPSEGFAKLQNEVENRSQATKERGRQWLLHREAYSKVKDRLQEMDGKLQYDVMVPLTSKAMMPGKLVHTNEILVLLGDNWFIETSAKEAAKIAGRRLEECDKMLRGLEEELRLNEGWRDQTKRMEGEAEGAVDIREEYDEEEDRKWREKHRENVKREKGEPVDEEKTEMSDIDLWSRLEELEVREALEKEWEEDESDEESEGSDVEVDNSSDEESVKSSEDKEEKVEIVEKKKQFKRRVSWGNLEKPVLDDGLEITFSHSDTPNPTPVQAPISQQGIWPPRTPGDVCLPEKKPSKSILKPEPSKSILKPASSSDLASLDDLVPSSSTRSHSKEFPPGFQPQNDFFSQVKKSPKPETTNIDFEEDRRRIADYVPAIADVVVEKNVGQAGSDKTAEEPKKVSRFKAARANKEI